MQMQRRAVLFALMGTAVSACTGPTHAAAPATPGFAIRLVDETVDGTSLIGPPGSDRFVLKVFGIGGPGARWLKRGGGVEGELAEVHVARAPGGGSAPQFTYAVQFTLTEKGRADFARLTRENIGKWMAIIVNGEIVTTFLNGVEMTSGQAQISGYFTEPEATVLATAMTATIQDPAKPL